jgi:hypothetical protein
MEKDDAMDSYGITDGSAGLRGDIIRTANNDVIKLYAASLLSGIAGAVSSGANGLLGNRIYTNNSSLGLSALQGGLSIRRQAELKACWTDTLNRSLPVWSETGSSFEFRLENNLCLLLVNSFVARRERLTNKVRS